MTYGQAIIEAGTKLHCEALDIENRYAEAAFNDDVVQRVTWEWLVTIHGKMVALYDLAQAANDHDTISAMRMKCRSAAEIMNRWNPYRQP